MAKICAICTIALALAGWCSSQAITTTPAFNRAFYPYGRAEGDKRFSGGDDSCVDIYHHPISMFGKPFNDIYVCDNGDISLGDRYTRFVVIPFPLSSNVALICPFWADAHPGLGGNIWSRETTDPALLRRASLEVRHAFSADQGYNASWMLIATWDKVIPFGSTNRPPYQKENTFQAVLMTDGVTSFAIFNYKDINWVNGTASEIPAQVGFDSGNGVNYYATPHSRQVAIKNVASTSNVGIPGKMLFKLGTASYPVNNTGTVDIPIDVNATIELPDINLCSSSPCNEALNATCVTTQLGYDCLCPDGYEGDGIHSCNDIDECLSSPCNVFLNSTCVNTRGSFYCQCPDGLQGDGINSCNDGPLCPDDTNVCGSGAVCHLIDYASSNYTCVCQCGFSGDGQQCEEIIPLVNECKEGTHQCHKNAICVDTEDAYLCKCKEGYHGDGEAECIGGIPCPDASLFCSLNGSCGINKPLNQYYCECLDGYDGNGTTCSDIDECEEGTNNCHRNALCTNTAGSFTCACESGYTGDGVSCLEVDECKEKLDKCDPNADCINTPGSYKCTCKRNYLGDGFQCKAGVACPDEGNACSIHATCGFDSMLSQYYCACKEGYTGDGKTCTVSAGVPCLDNGSRCAEHATCKYDSSLLKFYCNCESGYRGDGKICTEINECKENTHNCSPDRVCVNTDGGFTCDCPPGVGLGCI